MHKTTNMTCIWLKVASSVLCLCSFHLVFTPPFLFTAVALNTPESALPPKQPSYPPPSSLLLSSRCIRGRRAAFRVCGSLGFLRLVWPPQLFKSPLLSCSPWGCGVIKIDLCLFLPGDALRLRLLLPDTVHIWCRKKRLAKRGRTPSEKYLV